MAEDYLSRDECLRRLREDAQALRDRLEASDWSGVDANGWTPKDVLAHVGRWQARVVRWWMAGVAGDRRTGPEPGFGFDQIDTLNARDLEADREITPEDAWRRFEQSLAAVTGLLSALDDDDLNDESRVPWLGFPARHAIAGNTFGHMREHMEALEVDAG